MGTEIERKFLVNNKQWLVPNTGIFYSQGYLTTNQGLTVRIRIAGEQAFLTIKGPTQNYSRLEFEYPIPLADAQVMLDTLCDRPLIEKIRYRVQHQDLLWEIDEFQGDNAGLMIAEIELTTENQLLDLPDWVGEEVSTDPRYYNANLVKYPYCQWQK